MVAIVFIGICRIITINGISEKLMVLWIRSIIRNKDQSETRDSTYNSKNSAESFQLYFYFNKGK